MRGADLVVDATTVSLGPRGHNVAIDYGHRHTVVHDGVTIAESVNPRDPFEALGAKIIKEAAKKQRDTVGDGTTAVLALAQAIYTEANRLITAGVNAMALRAGLEAGLQLLLTELEEQATPIKTLEQAVQIASISSQDSTLGKLIGETVWTIGTSGVVTVEDSPSLDTVVEHQEGMQWDRGWASQYFINDVEHMEAKLKGSLVLVTDIKLDSLNVFMDLVPFLEKELATAGKTLTIISPEISGDALASLVMNKQQGNFNFLAINAPLYGEKQQAFLQDIALYTGGVFISEAAGLSLKDVSLDKCGLADAITAGRDETIILGGRGKPEEIAARVASIRTQLEEEESDYEAEKLKERLAKLTSGVSVIRVGGATEVEMKERKERVLDAVFATQAAMRAGVIAGGETAYLRIRSELIRIGYETEHEQQAAKILHKALVKPFEKLLTNAGLEPAKYQDSLKSGEGVDVTDGTVKDLMEAGIVDPVLVPQEALRNALSVAIQIITTEAATVPEVEEAKK